MLLFFVFFFRIWMILKFFNVFKILVSEMLFFLLFSYVFVMVKIFNWFDEMMLYINLDFF